MWECQHKWDMACYRADRALMGCRRFCYGIRSSRLPIGVFNLTKNEVDESSILTYMRWHFCVFCLPSGLFPQPPHRSLMSLNDFRGLFNIINHYCYWKHDITVQRCIKAPPKGVGIKLGSANVSIKTDGKMVASMIGGGWAGHCANCWSKTCGF